MDPNANLERMLELAQAAIERADENGTRGLVAEDSSEALAEYVLALHEWLTNGGFPPDAWLASGNEHASPRQGLALANAIAGRGCNVLEIRLEPFGLPAGYWLVRFADGFECGIAPDGGVSS